MAGIVLSTKRRMLIDKRVKEIEIPTNTLDTALFFQDLGTLGGLKSQATLTNELNLLPSIFKNESTTVLVAGAFKEGVIYGYNGDTKSVEEFAFTRNSSGTRFNSLGRLEIVPPNVPREDYDPITKVLRGYLLEPSSTNLMLYSGAGNYGSFEVLYSPDRARAIVVTEPERQSIKASGTNALRLSQVNIESGKKYTYSFWIRSSVPIDLRLANYNTTSYNITTVDIGPQWKRVVKTFEVPLGTTTDIFHMQPSAGGELPDIYVSDIQLEEGEIATSYIPTTNAIATRTADTIVSLRPLENFSSSTLFMKGSWISFKAGSNSSMFVSKSMNSRFWFETTGLPSSYVRTYNGAVSLDSEASENTELKLAVSVHPNGFKHCVNGAAVKSAASTFPNESLPLIIKSDNAILYFRSLAIVPRQLTDQELQTVTS